MELPTKTRFNQIIIERPEKNLSIIKSFVSSPPISLENKVGKIFGLIDVKSNQATAEALVDFIINQIQTKYYQSVTDDVTPNIDLETFFESTLQKINVAIATFLETENIKIDLKKVNIIIGVIREQQLIFTQIGRINIFLAQKLPRYGYRLIDILSATKAVIQDPDPLKLFSQVIAGQIKINNLLLLASDNIFDYFSSDSIKNVINQEKDRKNVFFKMFDKVGSQENFGLLLIEFEKNIFTKPAPTTNTIRPMTEIQTKDSVKNMVDNENKTQSLLTPSLMPEIKKYSKMITQAFSNYRQKIKDFSKPGKKNLRRFNPQNINLNKGINDFKKSIHLPKQTTRIKDALSPLSDKARDTIRKVYRQPKWKKFLHQIGDKTTWIFKKYQRLPAKSRGLLLISITLAIILTAGISYMNVQAGKKAQLAEFQAAIDQAQTNANDSAASLIYRDENLARQKLIEAKNLLTNLKPVDQQQTDQITTLSQNIEAQMIGLRHLVEINDITQIANFKNLDPEAQTANLLFKLGNEVYTQNITNKSLVEADLNSRQLSAIFSDANAVTGIFKNGVEIDGKNLLLVNEAKNAFLFNQDNETIRPGILNTNSTIQIAGLTMFNNRLYLLDSANNQIYRYNPTSNGFGSQTNWLTDSPVDLSNAVDLAIDGYIYVLKADGQIYKFDRGSQVELKLATVDPAFVSPSKLKVPANSNYIYVLDAPTKRIVVFDKNGNLVNQYTSDQLADLKDFVINETEKRIYALDGTSVIGFAIK
ncbi:MAG: hypothetical protein JW816_03550 [Candidatus Buchananbacteria bacterium]|nr:hypothetical protein [Candidatus Buchananbacteria bacterium]